MRILDGEIDLREETRTAEKLRQAFKDENAPGHAEGLVRYAERAETLSETQGDLQKRTEVVVDKIRELPRSEQFGKEIDLLTRVAQKMATVVGVLAEPETGDPAIVRETEIIEMLLEARRINPSGGGGGGGSSPGGGGNGTTDQAALALIGPGVDKDADIDERGVTQATGQSGAVVPAEFREGYDKFLNALENRGTN